MPIRPAIPLIAVALLGGCASVREMRTGRPANALPEELGQVPHGVARICAIRPETEAADVTMYLRDNGRIVGASRGGTFFCWLAAPGPHQIQSADDDTGPLLVEAAAGVRYWLHQEVSTLSGVLHAHLDWVDEGTAIEMIDATDARVRVALPGYGGDDEDALPLVPAQRL